MTPERWQQVEEVLQSSLDLPFDQRSAFLDDACGNDEDLRREAASLISAYDAAGDFIEQPAIAEDANVLLGDSVGLEIGPYTLVRPLGSGGMGEVYLAKDRRLDRTVAVKILPAYLAADEDRLRRFQREARAASALNHPNILTIHEVGEDNDFRFIATEFVDGQTLRELIEIGQLSINDILDITIQIASALATAHAAGIVHRDIKPENIMRRPDGLVKVLDFGIAKLLENNISEHEGDMRSAVVCQTEVGVVVGTVNYMSPEQARALDVDQRTDIWSLGVLLYEMLTQRVPFSGATRMDTLVNILERQPAPLDSSPSSAQLKPLRAIVDKTLHKDREQRYQSSEALLKDLRSAKDLIDAHPGSIGKQTIVYRSRANRKRLALVLAGVFLLLVAGAIVFERRLSRQPEAVAKVGDEFAPGKAYSNMSEAERLAFVDRQQQRVSQMMGDRPVKLNDDALRAIKARVDWFAARDGSSGEASLAAIYSRAPSHVPVIASAFAARKVPVIIGIYIPMIESAYRQCYESSFGARGLFQFLPETARHYGVSKDEMCDVKKMAPAAAHYIADRMAELGEDSQSLTLVLLSYNRGEEWVRNALREFRGSQNYQRDFWTLFANRDKLDEQFQKESAGYVPSFFAAAIIGENPQVFGLPTPPLSSLAGTKGEQ